jgi:hypothetical protein
MGLTTPNFPAIEPGTTVMDIPYRERMQLTPAPRGDNRFTAGDA